MTADEPQENARKRSVTSMATFSLLGAKTPVTDIS